MKKFILPILLIHLAVAVNAATYYFSSSSGDDSRSSSQAQSSSTPWKTISKLNSMMSILKPGDRVAFKRGDTFYGSITVGASGTSGNPITFGDYGSGNKPVITGLTTLSSWSQSRSNVWEASLTVGSGKENIAVMNNVPKAIGRYPNRNTSNGGYLNIDSHNGAQQVTSSQLPSSPDWTGADIAIRKNRWTIDRSKIGYHSGNSIGFDIGSDADINDNYGFFIENHTNTLDQTGEWFYDNSRKKFQMYFGSNNPTSYTIKASTVETLVTVGFRNYIIFENLIFEGANAYAFNINNSSNITLNFCNINYTGINAVQALSTDYLTLANCNINYTNNTALYLYWNCNYAFITGDVIKNTATFPGMAQSGNYTHRGIFITGTKNLIQYNEIDSTGSNAITFEGDYTVVQNNFINTFGFVIDDCGGIYTGQGLGDNTQYVDKEINNNIVINGIGAVDGTDNKDYFAAEGIYLDDNTNHMLVMNNTVANCGQAGIFSHNATYINIINNTMYNNGKEQFLAVRSINPASSVNFTGNIMFSKTASQLVSRMESYYGNNNIAQLGTVNNNYYCRPIDDNFMFYDMYLQNGQYYTSYETINSWRSKFGFDGSSATSPATFPAFSYTNASGVNLFTNGAFNQNINNAYSYSPLGDITTAWTSNKLDGGTFQATARNYSSTTNSFNLTFATDNSVTSGKSYLLSFTLQGAAGGRPMDVYLKDEDYPNTELTKHVIIPIPSSRNNFQFGFTVNDSKRVSIQTDIVQPNSTVWMDNVNLQQATITPTNPDDYIVFYYNPGFGSKQFTLPGGTYYDAKGATYSGTVTVPSYGSSVLFKAGTQNITNTATALQAISTQASLKSAVATTSADLTWQVDNQASDAVAYEVERSADTANFTLVGTASVKKNQDSANANVAYQFTDAQPLGGKNYYRIKQRDAKGNYVYSKVVMVNNISFKLNPNPARDVVHLQFDQAVQAEDHLGKEIVIRNTAGAVSQMAQMPQTGDLNRVDINVASLKPGLYVLSITSDGKAISRTFLKL